MRYTLLILFLLVLFTPIALRYAIGRTDHAGPQKDALDLVIITAHSEPIRREFEEAFSTWHQKHFGSPVEINYLNFGGAADMRRTLDAKKETVFAKSGTYEIDLAWGGGDTLFDTILKPHLEGIKLEPKLLKEIFPQPTIAGLRLYDVSDPPLWFGTALGSFGIGYNTDVVKYLGVREPRTWTDLKDPRYRGWLLLADPTRSSTSRTMFMVIVERAMADAVNEGRSADDGWAEGMGIVRQICANARNFSDSANILPTQVSSGEVAAAMTIDFYARSQMQALPDDRMGYVEPSNATVINPDPIGMLKGAPHRELAQRFVEFVLSEQGQRIFDVKAGTPNGPRLSTLRRLPVRQSVYSDMRDFADPVNPFEQTTTFNTSRDRTKTFGIIGELVQVSCIDLLEDLRETREQILACKESRELDAMLGRFPFDQKEALKRMEQFQKASAVEKLQLIQAWTQQFRDEYAMLRERAQKAGPK